MTLAPRGRGRARSAAFATVCAATDPNVNVQLLITAAAVGSIIGDNVGYLARKEYGYALLLRYGRHIGMSDAGIKIGPYFS